MVQSGSSQRGTAAAYYSDAPSSPTLSTAPSGIILWRRMRLPRRPGMPPAEMWEQVPQVVNLNTWPATPFVGRDGRVKHIRTGFAAPASGVFNEQLKQEFTSTIEQLLNEKQEATRAGLQ
jgi:hypothetical protein